MKPTKSESVLPANITRRDFLHNLSLASLGLTLPSTVWSNEILPNSPDTYYPPVKTGMRGSHPGSFEVAHALAREGKLFENARPLDEQYDLIVVGGGMSGLSAAHFYRKLHGPESRILILDNHDDFGGHAKRNEFHQGGSMRLLWGGTINMEYTHYSETAMGLIKELGIDIPRLLDESAFGWRDSAHGMKPSTWFDQETYGQDVLLPGASLEGMGPTDLAGHLDEFPISEDAREALRRFLLSEEDVLAGLTYGEKEIILRNTSYFDFLQTYFDLPVEAIQIFSGLSSGYWGIRAEDLSVAEALESSLPAAHVLGAIGQNEDDPWERDSPSAMFPDGNASIARLLVRSLIPGAFPNMSVDDDPFDIVTAKLDYGQLDQESSHNRLRLNSTVVHTENTAEGNVAVRYVQDDEVFEVQSKHTVLACYNRIIPSLCPDLPSAQKEALGLCIKRPMLIINVELRNGKALQKSGVSSAYLPGRLCHMVQLIVGVNAGDYHTDWNPEDACTLQFYTAVHAPNPDGLTIAQQTQAGRALLLSMDFEDFEREVSTVLSGIWGPSGLEPANDILAITVNRWPHGYARDHLDMEDEAWNKRPYANEVGRKPFGNITIANSDAGADAYTHTAIDQAWRAVNELK
jgi:spermidine dehydrogenase